MQINAINLYQQYQLNNSRTAKTVTKPFEPVFVEPQKQLSREFFESFRAQAIYSPSFMAKRKLLEHPFYNMNNYVPKPVADEKLVSQIKKFIKPNGNRPFKKEKDIYALIDGFRNNEVRDFQFMALYSLIANPLFEKGKHIVKLISQINTTERGELFIDQINTLCEKHPDLTAEELVAIIPRLTKEKLDIQEDFIENIYLNTQEKRKPETLGIFSELLSSIEDRAVANLQLDFFNNLMKYKDASQFTAISLVMNIDNRKQGVVKQKTIIDLIEKGFRPEDLVILIPKIKDAPTSKLCNKMADYFLHEINLDTAIAAKIMCNIPDETIFNLHKNIIEEATKLRDYKGEDLLKTLGDIQSPETADLKMAVINELAQIEKFDAHDITHIVTNVDTVYGAEIKVKTAKKLAEIDSLKGSHIGYIIAGCHNEDSARVKCKAAEELIKIPGMTGDAISHIVSRLLEEETANIQIEAVKELMTYEKFTPIEIAKIVRGMRNIDFQKAKFNALNHLLKHRQLDNSSLVKILNKINGESKDKYLLDAIDRMTENPEFTPEDITKIATTLVINKHTYKDLIDYFADIPRHIKDEINDYSIVQDFYPFRNKTYPNRTERKAYINALIKHNTAIFENGTEDSGLALLFPFLPTNNEEFCQVLPILATSVGKDTIKMSNSMRKAIKEVPQVLEKLYDSNGEFLKINFENVENPPTLKYNLALFKNDILEILKDCPPLNREQITDQFGFVISPNKESKKNIIIGYPHRPKTYSGIIDDNEELAMITRKLEYCINKFVACNQLLICSDNNINRAFNVLFHAIPELYTLVEKQQNEYHAFDTFTHTIRVMQEVAKNERFQKLNDNDKKILFVAALLHDITKKEGVVDKGHALTGAYDAYQIAKRLGFSNTDCSKLFAIIRNHEWLKYYNKEGVSELQKIERAKTIAFTLREGNAFELVSILSEADLKGMKKNNEGYLMYEKALREGNSEVARYVRDLQRTAIPLPQSKLPKASELESDGNIIRDANIGGIKNKVIYLSKNMNKGSLPFDSNIDPSDLNFLVHALDSEKNSLIFQRMDEVDNDTLISASYVNLAKGNWKTFRQQGFILDVDSDNIHAAYFKDYGSGATKNIDNLKIDYLFGGYFKPQRDYISQKIKEKLHINADSYKTLYQDIKNKSLAEIRKEYPFVSAAIKQIYMEMQGGQYTYGRNYNEVLVSRPHIQGVFAYDRSITQVPKYLRKYAADADIPIIIFLD